MIARSATATPDLGEHNDEILQSLGYDAEAIEKLKAATCIPDERKHLQGPMMLLRSIYSAASTAFAISAVPLLPPNSIGLMPSA